MSHCIWLVVQIHPHGHRSHPWLNNSKWYSNNTGKDQQTLHKDPFPTSTSHVTSLSKAKTCFAHLFLCHNFLATYNLITLCNQTVLCSVSELVIRIPDPSVITVVIAKRAFTYFVSDAASASWSKIETPLFYHNKSVSLGHCAFHSAAPCPHGIYGFWQRLVVSSSR